jgi:hypothetical protein
MDEIDDLCLRMSNTVLHIRLDEIKDDLQRINQYMFDGKYADMCVLAYALQEKHVYYNKSIHEMAMDINEAEINLMAGLYRLATEPVGHPPAYLAKTREFYIHLLDFVMRDD